MANVTIYRFEVYDIQSDQVIPSKLLARASERLDRMQIGICLKKSLRRRHKSCPDTRGK